VTKIVLKKVRHFAAGTDLTGASNKIELDDEFEVKDATTWGSEGAKEVLGGLESCSISDSGFWYAGDLTQVDDAMWAARGGPIIPWTAGAPNTNAAVGDVAYLTKALQTDYKFGGAPGDIAPWSMTAESDWPLVRGQILHPPGTARTSTGTGTPRQLGAVPAGSSLYVCLHVLSVSGGPTLTVTVESDDSSGFGSPTTVLTFADVTEPGGQALQLHGATTDDWFRVKYTITGGTTPSVLFVASAGIQ
jgi:hypothetical protein